MGKHQIKNKHKQNIGEERNKNRICHFVSIFYKSKSLNFVPIYLKMVKSCFINMFTYTLISLYMICSLDYQCCSDIDNLIRKVTFMSQIMNICSEVVFRGIYFCSTGFLIIIFCHIGFWSSWQIGDVVERKKMTWLTFISKNHWRIHI